MGLMDYATPGAVQQKENLAEVPALEDFCMRFQKTIEEINQLNSRLYGIANKLDSDLKEEKQPGIPTLPKRFNDGLLSKIETCMNNLRDQIDYQEKSIRKLEKLL